MRLKYVLHAQILLKRLWIFFLVFQVHPRGVQLHLGTETDSKLVDTLVMSNLGYFQLKTGPGSYNLTLAPGKSQDLYAVTSSDSDQVKCLPPKQKFLKNHEEQAFCFL